MNNLPPILESYDYRLVSLSVAIAIFASYAALDLAGRITASRGWASALWLMGGAIAMGSGIWSMHYTGMLAYRLPFDVYYHLPTVAISYLAAILASAVALFVVSRRSRMKAPQTIMGSLLMGGGIATMHYTGMAAMRLPAMHHYRHAIWLLSILLAVLISFVALRLTFSFREGNHSWKLKISAATLMGLAIPTMHYTGMAAITFVPMPTAPDLSHAVDVSTLGNSSIILITLVIIGFALFTSLVDRRLTAQAQTLAGSEQRYRMLFESNPHPTFVFDLNSLLVLDINQAALDSYGFTRYELLEMRMPQIEKGNVLQDLLRTHQSDISHEAEHRRKDDAALHVELRLRRIVWDGKPAGLLLINDITPRKRAEQERDAMEVQLRHAQKLESIGQLAAGIAHEINTPTQYIGDNVRFLNDAFSDIKQVLSHYEWLLAAAQNGALSADAVQEISRAIENTDIGDLFQEIPKAIQQTLDGVGRVSALVSAMKQFSHPGSKDKTLLNVNKAIESTIIIARNEWKYVAEMETHFDPSLPLVSCLPGELNQAILNLVVNAAHAIAEVVGDGGSGKGKIRVETLNCQDWVEIRIQDTGGGIPPKIQHRIFEPFFTTKEVGKGTGQGLAITHSVIVDKHKGSLQFETKEGAGTTFVIRLPLDAKAIPATPVHASAGKL